jgi:hypothetical protein
MGIHSENLKTATDTLLRSVIQAASAEIKAEQARTEQAPNLFVLAQAHRSMEKQVQDNAAACIKAARACIEAGELTLR